MVIERDKKLTIRISSAELAMLDALADAEGVSVSDYVRVSARRDYAKRFADQKPKGKR
jgi:uncharacterized protein (DUF1778 family)